MVLTWVADAHLCRKGLGSALFLRVSCEMGRNAEGSERKEGELCTKGAGVPSALKAACWEGCCTLSLTLEVCFSLAVEHVKFENKTF